MKNLFDIPAHAFFIHIPVVLTPLVCLAAIAIALRPSWRQKYGPLVVFASLVIFISILLAAWSGEPLNEIIGEIKDTEKHKELGEMTRLFAAGLFISTAALVGVSWWKNRQDTTDSTAATDNSAMKTIVAVLAAATISFAVLSTVWVVRTGHEGARVAHENTIPSDD